MPKVIDGVCKVDSNVTKGHKVVDVHLPMVPVPNPEVGSPKSSAPQQSVQITASLLLACSFRSSM